MSNALYFVPDISGFTDFVNSTEAQHSQHIISELLEQMIDANLIDLQLAEIEGDALFFYKEGAIPSGAEIIAQMQQIYLAFHQHLRRYENQRICDCGACRTAINLQLKFVAHAGQSQFIEVKGAKKPFGKDVIIVHRLLKNEVPLDEYFLITQRASAIIGDLDLSTPLRFEALSGTYDAGEISYYYAPIVELKEKLEPLEEIPRTTPTKNPLIFELDIECDPADVFEIISNLKYRKYWNIEADIRYDESRLNRAGDKHECLVSNRLLVFETLYTDVEGNHFVYGERTADFPWQKELLQYFIVKGNDRGARLRTELHFVPKFWGAQLLFKSIMKRNLQVGMKRIKELAESGFIHESSLVDKVGRVDHHIE